MYQFIDSFHQYFNYEVPKEIIENAFYSKLASVLSFKRIKFQLPNEKPVIANYYGMTFAPSGFGKDKVLRAIKNFAFDTTDVFIQKYFDEEIKKRKKNIERQAVGLFGVDWKKEQVKQKWLMDNRPRDIITTIGDSTSEGLSEDRLEISNYENGSLYFVHNEFFDYLIATEKNRSMLLTLLAEIFDHGDDSAKSLKTEKKVKQSVKGIPNNILVYSSAGTMHKNKTHEILLKRLEDQFARRSFIVFLEKINEKEISFDDYFKEKIKNISKKIDFNTIFYSSFDQIKSNQIYKIEPESETHLLYERYFFENKQNAKKQKNKIIQAEINGRSWKVLKLATIIHAFQNPLDENISKDALQYAIDWADKCASSFKLLVHHSPQNDFEKMWEYFSENTNKLISAKKLRSLKIFNGAYHANLMKEFIEYARDMASDDGMVFDIISGTGNSKSYILKTMSKKMKGE